MARKESTSIYLAPGTLERLRRLHQVTRVPSAVRVREALERDLSRLEFENAEALAALSTTAGK